MQHHFLFPEDRFLLIGTVIKAQGLKGEVCIHSFSGQPENLNTYHTLFLVDKGGKISPQLSIKRFRAQKGKAIVLFDRVRDRSHAEQLVGMGVLLAREDLPELAEDEFYWHQLIGLAVSTVAGEAVGTLMHVFSNGAQDVMVIQDGDQEHLVPLSDGVVISHDDEQLIIDPPQGLLEINSGEDEGAGHPK